MDINDFVVQFADALEDVDSSEISAETEFKDLAAWDSLTVLSVIAMIKVNYGATVSGVDVNNCTTVADVFKRVEKANG